MAVAALKERVSQESQELHAPKGEPVGGTRGCMVIDLQLALGLVVSCHRFSSRHDSFVREDCRDGPDIMAEATAELLAGTGLCEREIPLHRSRTEIEWCAIRSLTVVTSTDILAGFLT
jgi:hypothetical protein